jgi:hypothetical protein
VISRPQTEEETTSDNSECHQRGLPRFGWEDANPAAENYAEFGKLLSGSCDLFRRAGHARGLLMVLADGNSIPITTAADFAPAITDRIALAVYLEGKPKGANLSAAHLNSMLRSESFLGQFSVIDQITSRPVFLENFQLSEPGLNEGKKHWRFLHVGEQADVSDSTDHITQFLNVMDFDSESDRTNTVAAALTCSLRNHWPGGKPIVLVTATKSHAGKDTVLTFASGLTRSCSISYQSTNWALERSFIGALNSNPELGLVVIENARLDRRDQFIASAFIERFATDAEPFLFSTGTGPASRRRNDVVMGISTNFGSVSEDVLNRSLPIHLNPVGNIADRQSPIGNPRLEFLPTYREEIAAELRGMILRWKDAGQPLDADVRHPFSPWAATIGGILMVNGFDGFLKNCRTRKTLDDPLRKALGILGSGAEAREWRRPVEWARTSVTLGVSKQLISASDHDSDEGKKRGIGVTLSAHRDETFRVETDAAVVTVRLERRRGRFNEPEPHVRYRFVLVASEPLPE